MPTYERIINRRTSKGMREVVVAITPSVSDTYPLTILATMVIFGATGLAGNDVSLEPNASNTSFATPRLISGQAGMIHNLELNANNEIVIESRFTTPGSATGRAFGVAASSGTATPATGATAVTSTSAQPAIPVTALPGIGPEFNGATYSGNETPFVIEFNVVHNEQ